MTDLPALASFRAAASPENPAPTTTTSALDAEDASAVRGNAIAAAPAAAVESRRRRVICCPAGCCGRSLSCVCFSLRLRTKSPILNISVKSFRKALGRSLAVVQRHPQAAALWSKAITTTVAARRDLDLFPGGISSDKGEVSSESGIWAS